MVTHFITGAHGFIGSELADALERRNYDDGREEHVLRLDTWFSSGDAIINELRTATPMDSVYLLGAYADVAYSAGDPAGDVSGNLLSVVLQMEAARRAGAITFASSFGGMYADMGKDPIPETAAPQPLAPYFAGKLAAEHYLRLLRGTRPWAALRLANVYGPSQRARGVIEEWMRAAIAQRPLPVRGDLTTTRDFTYIQDVVDAFIRAGDMCLAGRLPGVVHIGTGVLTELGELAELIAPNGVRAYEMPRPGDWLAGARVDAQRAFDELGWVARTPLQDGLMRLRAWHEERMAGVSA